MVNYRRSQTPGGIYFVNRHNRRAQYLVTNINHLHAILTLPEADHDYSGRWRAIKSHFTHSLLKAGVDLSKNDKGEYKLLATALLATFDSR